MAPDEILETIREVMVDVFDIDDLVLTPETTAEDIAEWDSLSHIRLMVAIEREFGLKFTSSEIEGLRNVGALVSLIEAKTR